MQEANWLSSRHRASPACSAGILLQPINPKAYAVNTALFSGFAIWPDALWTEAAWKLVAVNVIWVPIHVVWVWAGVQIKRLDLGPQAQRRINFAMAAAMLGVVALAAASSVTTYF